LELDPSVKHCQYFYKYRFLKYSGYGDQRGIANTAINIGFKNIPVEERWGEPLRISIWSCFPYGIVQSSTGFTLFKVKEPVMVGLVRIAIN
jgi:hypothetical protein